MKLFQRTLLSFAGVIALQAALAGAALSAIFGSMQAEDAALQMSTEAANAFESFNAWKLAFWKDINELAEDRRLAAAIGAARGSPALDEAVARELSLRSASSPASATAVRDASAGVARYIDPEPDLPDPLSFTFKKEHPYVEIVSIADALWFVGAVRIAAGLDVFIVKKIDAELLGNLSYNPMVAVAIAAVGGPSVTGRYSGAAVTAEAEKAGRQAMVFALELLTSSRTSPGVAYARYPRQDWMGVSYAAVVQRTGSVPAKEGESPVLLATALSLAEYAARAARLQRAIVAVSLIVVVLTVIVALLLSRSIVSPIRLLSRAMHRIAEGDYRAELHGPASGPAAGEIGELLDGFNGMARKLAADKLELTEYITEIVGLKERGEGIIESIREGLAVIDAEGRIESANDSFLRLFGESAGSPGARIADIERGPFDENLMDTARNALRDSESRGGITRRAADGRTFEIKLYPLVAATRPDDARCIVVVEDASERLAYEERVIQADKLASIGMLSAGVAHEINNPLSSILANVGNAISEARDPETVSSLRVVERETHRIARIVRQLLDFSAPRRSRDSPGDADSSCDANAAARELVLLVGYPFRGDGRVEFLERLDPGCPDVAIPMDELKQVLLNLLKNALHAVGRGGVVRVSTRPLPGGVEISVADDGPGIPEDLMGRIFDPFFTTKQPQAGVGGAGLGLGLSVCYGIVTKRGGSIRAANEEGGGAVFVVELPVAGNGGGR
ncbi:MAG: ATP-binding protein [Spirochaetaceae bacterium]|nr:ATP-binding protein [Spirochaetaceae bacterium]